MHVEDTERQNIYYPGSVPRGKHGTRKMRDESCPSEFRKIEAVLLTLPSAFVVSLNVDSGLREEEEEVDEGVEALAEK